uniref:Uncharacterized protein n=1 Tax=Romanomermis culicivorax TaxID=13658 RepID=A0A915IVP6_ROMCU
MICHHNHNVTAEECITTLICLGDYKFGSKDYMGVYKRIRIDGRYTENEAASVELDESWMGKKAKNDRGTSKQDHLCHQMIEKPCFH